METARRLGIFSLVLAFILYVFYDQSELSGIEWRGQLIVYSFLFGILGIILLTRFRGQPKRTGRFSWIRNWLFRSSEKKNKSRRSRRRDDAEDPEE